MNTPLISVCVPIYNGEDYLDACLASIAAQSFGDFEVLVVDDCSTDAGVALARRRAASDARFQVHVNERNLGLVGNWNRCLALARGRWIKYLFQDDLMDVECLAEMLAAGNTSDGFVACARKLLFEGGIDASLVREYADHRAVLDRIYGSGRRLTADEYSDAKLGDLGWNIVGEPSVTMIDRRLFERYGPFDPMLVQFCDSEMWNRLGSNVGVVYVGRELVSFRVHRGSASEANRGRKFRSEVLDALIELNRMRKAPAYERFRAYAKVSGKARALNRRSRHRVNEAFEKARRAAAERPPNATLRDELRAVLGRLPGYTASRFGYALHRIRRRLSRRQ